MMYHGAQYKVKFIEPKIEDASEITVNQSPMYAKHRGEQGEVRELRLSGPPEVLDLRPGDAVAVEIDWILKAATPFLLDGPEITENFTGTVTDRTQDYNGPNLVITALMENDAIAPVEEAPE